MFTRSAVDPMDAAGLVGEVSVGLPLGHAPMRQITFTAETAFLPGGYQVAEQSETEGLHGLHRYWVRRGYERKIKVQNFQSLAVINLAALVARLVSGV